MQWLNEPPSWKTEGNTIRVTTGPKTDFWRKTHSGDINDNGHFYHEARTGDFVASVKFSGQYSTLYDQAGLMLRLDEKVWMKTGIEFVDDIHFVSAVVTHDFSDWSVVPVGQNRPLTSLWLRVTRHGVTVEVHYSFDDKNYAMLRQAYLTEAATINVGVMCASPIGNGFNIVFEDFRIEAV
jgi:uncharacterized protein